MTHSGRRKKKINVRQPTGERRRVREPRSGTHAHLPGFRDISKFPGYNPRLRGRRLRLCVDHDVPREITEALNDIGINTLSAEADGVAQQDDHAILQWTRRKRRVLLTCNYTDFYRETKYKLHQCPGIIASSLPNDGLHNAHVVAMLHALLDQLGDKVERGWWDNTKVKIGKDRIDIKKYNKGKRRNYKIMPASNGRLWYRQR